MSFFNDPDSPIWICCLSVLRNIPESMVPSPNRKSIWMMKSLYSPLVHKIDPFLSGPLLAERIPFSAFHQIFPSGATHPSRFLPLNIFLSFGSFSFKENPDKSKTVQIAIMANRLFNFILYYF